MVAGGTVTLNDGSANTTGAGLAGAAVSANGSGNILIDVNVGDLTINSDILSTTGHITLKAAGSVLVGSSTATGVDVTTGTAGTISVDAEVGVLTMAGDATITATNSSIRLNASTNVTLGNVVAMTVSVVADSGSIINAAGSTKNVTAMNLRLQADDAIGASNNHLTTAVATLTALSTGTDSAGIYLTETDAVTVDTVSVTVTEFSATAITSTVTDASQSDLRTLGKNGNIVLVAGGAVTLNDGADVTDEDNTDDKVVRATGNILLTASGAEANIVINASIVTTGGNISLQALGNITQNRAEGDIATAGGTIDLTAGTGINMVDGALTQTVNGNISYKATTGDITLGEMSTGTAGSTTGQVAIIATVGSIFDLGFDSSAVDITASGLLLYAGTAIAMAENHLDTQVVTLSTKSTTGGTFLTEKDGVTVDGVAVAVMRILPTGSVDGTQPLSFQAEMHSGSALVLQTTDGAITTAIADGDIMATGNIMLNSGEADESSIATITLNASVLSVGGNITLLAKDSITQSAIVGDITVSGGGKTIDLAADDAIVMGDGALTQSTNGNIRYQAGTNVTIELLAAGSGNVAIYAASGSITDGDIVGDTEIDITAAALLLSAGTGIGSGSNHLETTVTTLAESAGIGGMFITESNALTAGYVSFDINRVNSSAGTSAVSSSLSDLTTSGVGNAVLVAITGDITLTDGADSDSKGVEVNGTGNIRIEAKAGAIELQSIVTTGGGNITLLASHAFTQTAAGDIITTGSGTINVEASTMTMADGAAITSGSGNIRLVAVNTLQLGSLSTTGDVSLSASTISDSGAGTSDTTNITSDEVRLVTTGAAIGNGAGTSSNHLELNIAKLATDINGTGTGGLFFTEANSIQLGMLNTINAYQVAADGTTALTGDAAQSNVISDAHLVLVTTAGSIETLSGGAVTAAGNILLQAGGTTSDLTLGATVASSNGNISLEAGRELVQNAAIAVASTGSTIELLAGGSITMDEGTSTTSTNGNIRYQAGTNVTIELLAAGSGNVAIYATSGSITDGDTVGDTEVDITANGLLLSAGTAIGSGSNHLETTVTKLAASAGGGGMFMTETNGITVGAVSFDSNRVNSSAGTSAVSSSLSDLTTSGVGNAVLVAITGDIMLTDGSDSDSKGVDVSGTGNIRLEAKVGAIETQSVITTGGGNITLLAGNALTQVAAGDIITIGSGTINVEASTMSMVDGATITSGSGNIRLVAASALQLGSLSTTGDVSLSASTIGDAGAGATDTTNITADEVLLVTTGTANGDGVGSGSNHLELKINKLAADSNGKGGLFLTEANSIQFGTLNAINAIHVAADGSIALTGETAQSNVISDGHFVLVTMAGSIETLAGGAVTVAGNMLLQAGESDEATAATIKLHESVTSSAGNITLLAKDSILQMAGGDISALATGKTIDLQADDALAMVDGAVTQSANGDVRLEALSGDITLGSLLAGTAAIEVNATVGNIFDADGASVDITAKDLILAAGGSIGASDNYIEVAVINISSKSGSGATYLASSGVTVNAEELNVAVNRVNVAGGTDVTATYSQDNLSASEDIYLIATSGDIIISASSSNTGVTQARNIILLAYDGDIIINCGTDGQGFFASESIRLIADNGAVIINGATANSAGLVARNNILISAGEFNEVTDADITLNARLISEIGCITLLSDDAVVMTVAGDVTTQATGKTIDLQAAEGISMADGAVVQTNNGNIRYAALGGDVTIGELQAGSGTVAVMASGSILDLASDTGSVDITASSLLLSAGSSIGASANHLETTVGTLSTASTSGSTFITESDSVMVTTVSVTVERVQPDDSLVTTNADTLFDLTSGGDLVLQTLSGSIVTALTTGNITAAGNILLQAGGTTSDLTLGGTVASSNGNISLEAGRELVQNATIVVGSAGSTIELLAGGSITMAEGTSTTSTNGNIRYQAGANVTIELLSAGTGNVALYAESGFIGEGAASDSDVDITANGLLLSAGTGIGSGSNHLETTVTALAASAGAGGMFITESNALIVGAVSFDINRVSSSAGTSAVSSSLSDLTTSGVGNAVLVAITGDITLTDGSDSDSKGVDVSGTGNIRFEAQAGSIDLQSGITAGGGNITLLASHAFTQAAVGDISISGTGTVNVEAFRMSMADGASISSGSGNIRLVVENVLQLGSLSTTGDVSLSASTISDAGAGATDTTNITADEVRLVTTDAMTGSGAGTSSNHLELNISKLAADISSMSTGGLFLTEANNIELGALNAINACQVAGDGTATVLTGDAAQSNVISDGHLVLVTTAGSIESLAMGGAVTSEGNTLLHAGGAGSDLTLGAAVTSNGDHITLKAADALTLNSAVAVTTSGSGTISVDAEGGALTMAGTSSIGAPASSIRLNGAGDVTLGKVSAAYVSVLSDSGSILSAAGSTKNVTATNLRLQADDAIGASGNHLTTSVAMLSALSTGTDIAGIYVTEDDAVTVDTVKVSVTEFSAIAGTSIVTEASQSDLRTLGHNGNIVLVAGGAVTVTDGTDVLSGQTVIEDNTDGKSVSAHGSGSILLNAGGAGSDLAINANIVSGSGNITLKAMDEITVASGVQVTTAALGTISMNAGGALTMAGNSTIEATNSSLRLSGYGDVTVGNLRAANVSVVSERGAIINAAGSTKNVIANTLRLQAYGSIGSADRAFTTQVHYMSADPVIDRAGIYIEEEDDIVITSVTVNVVEITSIAETLTVVDVSLSDMVTSANGTIQLVTLDGSITINDGDGNGVAISANGTGDVTLQAGGSGSDVIINAAITTDTGKVVIFANRDVVQQADIETAGSSVSVESATGSITMSDGVQTTNSAGTIAYHSYEDVALGLLSAETGAVQVYAETGSITTSTNGVNVSSESVVLQAGDNVGLRHIAPLQLSVDRVAAEAVTGGMDIVNDTTIMATSIDGGEGLVQGLSAGDGLSLKSLHGDIVIAAPVDTKGTADAIISFPEGTLQADKLYFDDAGTFMNVQYKQLQYLWNQSQDLFVPDSIDSSSINDRLEIKYHQSAHDRAEQGSSNTPERRRQMYRTVESLLVEQVAVEEHLDAYVEIKNGHLHFKWGEVQDADSYLLVVEHEKTEFASRWLEDISWAPFESFPAGIYDWSVYSWATDGLKLVYGPMQFKI